MNESINFITSSFFSKYMIWPASSIISSCESYKASWTFMDSTRHIDRLKESQVFLHCQYRSSCHTLKVKHRYFFSLRWSVQFFLYFLCNTLEFLWDWCLEGKPFGY